MPDPVILALDTATTTGWAYGRPGDEPQFGSRSFAGPGGNGEILCKFRIWLAEMCRLNRVGMICYEQAYIPMPKRKDDKKQTFVMNPKTVELLYSLTGEVQSVAWQLRIKCFQATTLEICKFFTGRGSHGGRDQKKAAIIARANQYGWACTDSDAADALALWAMAENIINPGASSRRGDGELFLPVVQLIDLKDVIKPKRASRRRPAPEADPVLL